MDGTLALYTAQGLPDEIVNIIIIIIIIKRVIM